MLGLFIVMFSTVPAVGAGKKEIILKVLTLNTWMIPGQRKMAAARAQAIGRQIGKYDLVALQETFTAGMRKTIATTTKRLGNKFFNRYQRSPIGKLNSGKFTLSKLPIVHSVFKQFQNCSGIQCMAGKGILYIQAQLPSGDLIDVFNTHLQANERDMLTRRWQLVELSMFIEKINNGERPAIFMGDFNVIAQISEYQNLVDALPEFMDVWNSTYPHSPGYTWNPEVNNWAYYTHEESFIKQRLDYIFIRNGKKLKWKIADTKIAMNQKIPWDSPDGRRNYIFASDHFGVEATLELHI